MKLFLDLDGVMADFDKGALKVLGMSMNEYEAQFSTKEAWRKIYSAEGGFFNKLDWMPDGQQLWDATKHLEPTVITGCPLGKWAPKEKRDWCAHHLGWDIPVITCMAREKHLAAMEHLGTDNLVGCVLIDDRIRPQVRKAWVELGGTLIHHKTTAQSLDQLRLIAHI